MWAAKTSQLLAHQVTLMLVACLDICGIMFMYLWNHVYVSVYLSLGLLLTFQLVKLILCKIFV